MILNKRQYKLALGLVLVVLGWCVPDNAIGPYPAVSPAAAVQSPDTSPRLVLETGGHTAVINELIFSADGRELVSVSDDKTIRVWSVTPDGRKASLTRTIRGQIEDGRAGEVFAATLSSPATSGRQQLLAVGGYLSGPPEDRNAVRLHDFASGEVRYLLKGHTDNVLALAFSPTGRWLASAGKDRSIRVWDLSALKGQNMSKAPLVLQGHADRITGLAWSASGDRLASASYDGTVGLWDTGQLEQEKAQIVTRLQGHDGKVRSVAFHPNGTVLASGGQDRKIRLWQASDGKSRGVLAKADHLLSALEFSPDGKQIVAGNFTPPKPKYITLFSYPAGKKDVLFSGHDNLVVATAFHPSGRWLASGGGDHKQILLWSARDGKILSRLEGQGQTVYSVGFSKDGRFISWGQSLKFSSINNRGPLEYRFDLEELDRLPGGISKSDAIRAQESVGKLSLTVERGGPHNYDYRLHVKQGRKRLGTIERGPKDGFWHSAYTLTPDGQYILSGGQNGELRLYTPDAKLRARFIGHTGEIKAVAVSGDGRWALSGANDQTLILWNLAEIPGSDKAEISPTLTLFPTADGEWIAWTPDGYFTASPRGSHLIGYSLNRGFAKTAEYISVDQLYDRFYRPDLVYTKLHGDPKKLWQQKEASIDVKTVIAGGIAPRVAFTKPTADTAVDRQVVDVHANVLDQGGGIGKVVWRINGTTVAADSYAESSTSRLATGGRKQPQNAAITLTQQVSLLPGDNTIELVAYNRRNEIASPPVALTLTVRPPPDKPVAVSPTPPPKLSSTAPAVSPPPTPSFETATAPPTVVKTPESAAVPSTVKAPTVPAATPSKGPPLAVPVVAKSTTEAKPQPTVASPGVKPPSAPSVAAQPSTQKPTPGPTTAAQTVAPETTPSVVAKAEPPPAPSRPTKTASPAALPSPAPQVKKAVSSAPKLHLLVVGINRYRDKALRLKYAVQDGRAIIETVRQTAGPLFQEVNVTPLFDDQVTIGGLDRAFNKVKESIDPQDVFMLYLAGHGVTLDGRYYFLPQDFRYYNDEALRNKAINQDHLQRWLAGVPARKSLVLIDTCESGSFSQSLVAMRGMAEKTAIAKLTRATGRATIVASTDAQPAAEGYEGHGVFTYVLLQGLRHADTEYGNRDGYTGLFELAAYVNDQVPAITMKAFNFEQIPQVHMLGTDFPIGIVSTTTS